MIHMITGSLGAAWPIIHTGEPCMSMTRVHRARSGLIGAIGTTALLTVFVVVGAGCADVRKTFWADVALDAQLKREFHEPTSVVGPTNGVLMVSAEVSQGEAKKVMPGLDRERALRIAKFARSHYTDTIGLRAITVFFITKPDGVLPHLPHSYLGMTWSIRSLDAEPDPAPTVLPDQSAEAR
jgi:hypothetical protein